MVGKAKRSPQEMKRNCTSEIITMVYNGSSLPVFIKMENIVSRKCTVSIHWTSIHFSFFSLSPFLPFFFFSSDLLPAVTQQWWTAIYTDDSINILEKYIRLFYIFTSVPYVPLVILFFSSRTLLLLSLAFFIRFHFFFSIGKKILEKHLYDSSLDRIGKDLSQISRWISISF